MWYPESYLAAPAGCLLFVLVALLPGALLAAVATHRRRVHVAEFVALALGLGLMAVPLLAYLVVLISGRPLAVSMLVMPSLAVCLSAGWAIRKGYRPASIVHDRWFWGGLAAVFVTLFLTHDPSLLVGTFFTWVRDAAGNCFRVGTFQYLGIPSAALARPMPPAGFEWDGVMRGNVVVSSLFTGFFGLSGFRWLRVTSGLLLAAIGSSLGRHFTRRPAGGYLGMAVFALNPFMVMVQEADRNVLALAFGALLFLSLQQRLLPAWANGVMAGWLAGLGLQMLPALFIVPMLIHYLWGEERDWKAAGVSLVSALVVVSFWLAAVGWYELDPLAPAYTYSIAGLSFQTNYVLGFPFTPELVRAQGSLFPPALAFPLHVVGTFGAILVGVALLGSMRLWQLGQRAFYVALAFAVPPILLLLPMVNLVEDQLRLVINTLLPFLLALTVGLDWLLDRRFAMPRAAIAGGLAMAVCVSVCGLSRLDFPVAATAGTSVEERRPVSSATGTPVEGSLSSYLTQEAIEMIDRRGAAAPRAQADVLAPWDKLTLPAAASPFSAQVWLPDYVDSHPSSRTHKVLGDRWLDFELNSPADLLTSEQWEERVKARELQFWPTG